MSNNTPDSEQEVISEIGDLLTEQYDEAKRAHIWAETATRERNWKALVNFRDALHHESRIFHHLNNGEIDEAKEELTEMEAHIQRVAYDSASIPVEYKLSQVFDKRLPSILYRITFLEYMDDNAYRRGLDEIQEEMVKARESRTNSEISEPIQHFRRAYEIAEKLDDGTPPKRVVYFRALSLVVLLGLSIFLLYNGVRVLV